MDNGARDLETVPENRRRFTSQSVTTGFVVPRDSFERRVQDFFARKLRVRERTMATRLLLFLEELASSLCLDFPLQFAVRFCCRLLVHGWAAAGLRL